jgi:hypothetical protein
MLILIGGKPHTEKKNTIDNNRAHQTEVKTLIVHPIITPAA